MACTHRDTRLFSACSKSSPARLFQFILPDPSLLAGGGCTRVGPKMRPARIVFVGVFWANAETALAAKPTNPNSTAAEGVRDRWSSGGPAEETAGNTTLPTPSNAFPEIMSVVGGVMRNSPPAVP
jgi:hypothetical protein